MSSHFPGNRIDVINLECIFGFNRIFESLNFSVSGGTAIRILGCNGAGKTSLLRILCGLTLAENGEIHFNNIPIQKCSVDYRSALCYLGHKVGLKDDLTPLENLDYLSKIASRPYQRPEKILNQFNIGSRHNKPCRLLSAGQKQRIAIARTIASGASIWLLDEPAIALDSSGIALLAQEMQNHIDRNGLIIFSSHQPIALDTRCLKEIAWTKPMGSLSD